MNINKIILTISIFLIFNSIIIFNSCSDDTVTNAPPPAVTNDLILLDTSYAIGGRALVSFYVEETLKVGYNNIYIVLHDSVTNAVITDAHVEFDPVNHSNSAPVENPDELAVDGKFKGAMILNESQADHWHYHIHVHNHQAPGEPEGEAEFEDFVVKENPGKLQYIAMPDSTKLYLSYIKPTAPVTGMNNFEFLINRDEISQFPADGSYTIQVNPVYSKDGHTTTGNTNPTGDLSDGHYKGQLNLDRNGDWLINLNVSKNGISRETYFTLNY